MIDISIKDAFGSGKGLRVSDEGEANVVVHSHPPRAEGDTPLPLREYLTLNGAGSINDMRVNGATSNAIFSVLANTTEKRDKYISAISFAIADAGASLNQFGNIGSLSNGFELRWVTDTFGTVVIADSLKTNFEFIRMSGGDPAFGDGTGAFRANNVSGNSEGYIPFVDFDEIFGLKWGFRLRYGTNDRIEMVIKDNVTGVDQFDAIAYGLRF